MVDSDRVLALVEAHVVGALGVESGRASVSFVGAEPIEVLRFGPDPDHLVRYVTLGMSRRPMTAADEIRTDADGPRAELLLTVRGSPDSVLRRLAILAASPVIEGLVVGAGARLDLGEPLWDDGAFTSVLVGEPDGVVPRLHEPPVEILPLFPMTRNENAWARIHGSQALVTRWLRAGCDLRDPWRRSVDLADAP